MSSLWGTGLPSFTFARAFQNTRWVMTSGTAAATSTIYPRAKPRRQCNLRGRLYKSSTSPLACRELVGVVLRNRDGFLVCAENGSYMNASLWFGDFIVPPPAKCQGFLVNLYIFCHFAQKYAKYVWIIVNLFSKMYQFPRLRLDNPARLSYAQWWRESACQALSRRASPKIH